MNMMTKRGFMMTVAVAVLLLGILPSEAAKSKTEDELIAELSGTNADKVAHAMQELEKQFPTTTKALPELKKMLTDSREKVRRKAGRVLGVLHAEVSAEDLKNITAMFKAADPQEVMDALKSLRGLKATSVLPEILSQLKSTDIGVIRDACRTVAALGSKANVQDIEPLLTHPDAKVQKDAKDAIFALQARS